jgi:hypothetical protein
MSSKSLAHLYEIMAPEPPLREADVKIFLANASVIYNQTPILGQSLPLPVIVGWTDNRLVYVVTKINLGILLLVDPRNSLLATAPEFAKPTPLEMETIIGREQDLIKALERLAPSISQKSAR